MRMFWATLASLVGGFALVTYLPPAHSNPPSVSIHLDPGGNVGEYLRWYRRLADAHIMAHIDGSCVSACTLVLAMPKDGACITQEARLGFHLASVNGLPDPVITQQLVDEYYPPAVQKWIKEHGPLQEAPIYMMGSEAISLGIMQECAP